MHRREADHSCEVVAKLLATCRGIGKSLIGGRRRLSTPSPAVVIFKSLGPSMKIPGDSVARDHLVLLNLRVKGLPHDDGRARLAVGKVVGGRNEAVVEDGSQVALAVDQSKPEIGFLHGRPDARLNLAEPPGNRIVARDSRLHQRHAGGRISSIPREPPPGTCR